MYIILIPNWRRILSECRHSAIIYFNVQSLIVVMLMFTFQPFHQSFLFLLLKQQSSFYLFCTEFSEAWPNPCLQANLWTPVGPTIKSLEIAALHSTQHASVLTLYRGSSKASFLFLFTWMASSWTRWALCSFSFADSGALSPALWHHYVDYLYVICYDFRYLFYHLYIINLCSAPGM